MKMFRENKIQFMLFMFVLLSCLSCQQNNSEQTPFQKIKDQQARQILEKALTQSGGYDRWLGIDSMVYTKRSILYDEDGSIESAVLQRHYYRFHPHFEAEISWLEDSLDRQLIYRSESVKMYQGDSFIAEDRDSDRQAVMSALYVLAQPYKLLDDGATITYRGRSTLPNGKLADVIEASYDPIANENHSTQDLWWYHFDPETGDFLGSMVFHSPTYAWIENLSFVDDTPVRFHAARNSYRVDSLMNIQYLRASFEYSDYEVWE